MEATVKRLLRIPVTLLFLTALVVACRETLPTDAGVVSSDAVVEYEAATFNSVTDRVSVGGADICEAIGEPTGCNANFSLTARKMDDESVKGQWQDTLDDGEVIHVAIDCLKVVDNWAILGGKITQWKLRGVDVDVAGRRALTAVVDNGTSANDTADEIGYTVIGQFGPFACTFGIPDDFRLNDLTHGQVTIR